MPARLLTIGRSLKFVVAVLLLSAAALFGLHGYLESGAFRHFVAGKISDRLQAPVTFDQNLDVTFGLPVRVTLHGMHIANPDWAAQPDFMQLDTLVVTAHLQHFWEAKLGLDIQRATGGRIRLERGPKGQLNVPHPAPPGRLIYLHSLAGMVAEDVTLENAHRTVASVRKLKISAADNKGRLALDVNATLEDKPLRAKLSVPDRRRIKQKDSALTFKIDSLSWGRSDLEGKLTLDLSRSAPSLHGALHARKWELSSLGTSKAQAADKNAGNPFPATPIPTFWRALAKSEVKLKVDRLLVGGANAGNLHAHLLIDNDTLRIDPLTVDISKGVLTTRLSVDASKQLPVLRLVGGIKHLDLSGAIGPLLSSDNTRGDINAKFDLRGAGEDARTVLGDLNGNLHLVMQNGQLSNALLNRMAINLGRLLSLQSKGDGSTRIRCLVIEANAKDGVLTLGQTIADTERLLLVGDGNIDLRAGTVDVSLNPSSTNLSEVGIPIDIRGPLTHPKGQIDKSATVAKAAAALVNGVLGVPGKLTNLIGLTGGSGDSGCHATLAKYAQ